MTGGYSNQNQMRTISALNVTHGSKSKSKLMNLEQKKKLRVKKKNKEFKDLATLGGILENWRSCSKIPEHLFEGLTNTEKE